MAIEKTIFTNSTLSTQAPELLAYLQQNAAQYFDEITADASGNISCTYDGVTALLIGMDGTTQRKVTLANGTYAQCYTSASATTTLSEVFEYGKVAAGGVMLATKPMKVLGSNVGRMFFFITKNEHDDTVIFGLMFTGESSTLLTYYFADIHNDATIFKPLDGVAKTAVSQLSHDAPLTALTRVIFSGGHYAPKAYINTFSQFALTEADLNINGKSYASDGICSLED
jgi:hypothetical protein